MTSVELGLPGVADPRAPEVDENEARFATGGLPDQFGRVATDLRVSLTDRCNLRCTYCMPAEGLDWLPPADLLDCDELTRLLRVAVTELGIREVRFTGGEPLLRRDLVDIVAATAGLDPRPEISLTTNGLGLARKAEALARAGLDRVNVSLDTVDRDEFHQITRRDRLSDVLEGLEAAHAAGLRPIKINAVLQPHLNAEDAPALLRFCLDHGYELRIIEQMPLDAGHGWARDRMITAAQVRDTLGERFALSSAPTPRGSAPAQRWLVDGGPATVGIIASVTEPFCGACDRTRLTADGQVRNCLFAREESDLRALLRGTPDSPPVPAGPEGDEQLARRWRAAMWTKRRGHGIDRPGFTQPDRPMSAIGG